MVFKKKIEALPIPACTVANEIIIDDDIETLL